MTNPATPGDANATPAVPAAGTPDPTAGTPTPSPGPTSAAAPVALPDFQAWRGSLDPELRDQPSLANIESFEGLVREHANVQRFIGGDKISKPGDDATEEDWNRHYGAMGRPDQATGYDLSTFKPPENLPWDGDYQDRMVGVLHKNGVTQRQILGILNDTATGEGEQANATRAAFQAHQDTTDAALRSKWGMAYDGNRVTAGDAFAKVLGEDGKMLEFAMLPDGTRIGDSPLFMEKFFELGKMMREAGMIGDPSKSVSPVMTPVDAQARIHAIETSPGWLDILADTSPQGIANPIRKEWNSLHDLL